MKGESPILQAWRIKIQGKTAQRRRGEEAKNPKEGMRGHLKRKLKALEKKKEAK